jgi:hypothetical protein
MRVRKSHRRVEPVLGAGPARKVGKRAKPVLPERGKKRKRKEACGKRPGDRGRFVDFYA